MIALRPLREDEYAAWDEAHRAEYERGLVAVRADWSRRRRRAKVERDVPAVLPDGLATAGTRIWAVEEDGRRVGTVFLGLRDGGAFLYDITIDPEERGRGVGRGAMLALEDEVRALGHDSVDAERLGRERGRARPLPLARLCRAVGAHGQAHLTSAARLERDDRSRHAVELDVRRRAARAQRARRAGVPLEVGAERGRVGPHRRAGDPRAPGSRRGRAASPAPARETRATTASARDARRGRRSGCRSRRRRPGSRTASASGVPRTRARPASRSEAGGHGIAERPERTGSRAAAAGAEVEQAPPWHRLTRRRSTSRPGLERHDRARRERPDLRRAAGTLPRDRDRGRPCSSFTACGDCGDESTRGDTWLSPRKPSRS